MNPTRILEVQRNVNLTYGRWGRHVTEKHIEKNSRCQIDDAKVAAENRPEPKKIEEPKSLMKPPAL